MDGGLPGLRGMRAWSTPHPESPPASGEGQDAELELGWVGQRLSGADSHLSSRRPSSAFALPSSVLGPLTAGRSASPLILHILQLPSSAHSSALTEPHTPVGPSWRGTECAESPARPSGLLLLQCPRCWTVHSEHCPDAHVSVRLGLPGPLSGIKNIF